jgi:hypothetical protein
LIVVPTAVAFSPVGAEGGTTSFTVAVASFDGTLTLPAASSAVTL